MRLSDHVAVMNDGRVEQQGPPHDTCERVATRFVADFIGVTTFVTTKVREVAADGTQLAVEFAAPKGAALRHCGDAVRVRLQVDRVYVVPDACQRVSPDRSRRRTPVRTHSLYA